MTSHQVKAYLSPHHEMLGTPGQRRRSPNSVVDDGGSVVESVIARREDLELFRRQMETMLRSHMPTQFILGKVVEDVIIDDVVNERDAEIISRALDKQQEVWNLIMLTDTLLLGITFGQTMERPSAHADIDEASAAILEAAYILFMTTACVGFLLGAALTGLVYAYTKVLYLPDDVIWFLVSVQHEAPIVLMIASLILFFLGGLVGSYLTHGPVLGAATASVWLFALVGLGLAWNCMRRALMGRFCQEHKLRRTLHGQRTTAARRAAPPRTYPRPGFHVGPGSDAFFSPAPSMTRGETTTTDEPAAMVQQSSSKVQQQQQQQHDRYEDARGDEERVDERAAPPAVQSVLLSPFVTSTKREHTAAHEQSSGKTSLI